MDFSTHKLKDGQELEIREALAEDASDILNFVHKICTESDFLTFGQGEFNISEAEEKKILRDLNVSENQIYLVTSINNKISAILNFNAGQRPRIRHSGEFSMVVQKQYWGSGIGSHLIDVLLEWAMSTQIIKKINCRVRIDNQYAILLYERKGFVIEGTIKNEIFLNGKFYDLYHMGLQL